MSSPIRPRPYSRTDSGTRTSLVLTKNNFLNTLITNKATGVPVYATITQAGTTVLYATDSTMTLQRVAEISWGQGSRKATTVTTGENSQGIDDILPTKKIFIQLLSTKGPTQKYVYGGFACTWVESGYAVYSGGVYSTCYKPRSLSTTHSGRRDSFQRPDQDQLASRDEETLSLATLECYTVPGKPRYHIHIMDRDLLRQTPGTDGLTELDHVVLGALLMSSDPPTQHKGRATPEGWMDEAAVQNLLWSSHSRPVPGEIPPLYTAIAEATGENGILPPYASRVSLV